MEKVNVYDLDGKKKILVDMPRIFSIKPRKDLIRKASEISFSKNKQVQGRNKRAGLRNTAKGWGTGHGISRAPRIKGSGFPTARNVGRVPFAKGGRRAHPIKTEKIVKKKINKKVNKLSLISAISASGDLDWVKNRGHLINKVPEIPLVIDDKIQTVKKTKLMYSILSELGLEDELVKVKEGKKIRAGKGKRRGRKYKNKKSILVVIKDDFGIVKASRNIPGVDVIKFENLSIANLAPGGLSGRLILWAQSAFNDLKNYEALI
ncbi:MAG: 50S ribosomal protein L4 [Promethearchaeota archaeon Loki_b31]|nr:MAG: 50S ribosomal protein L4 [Candidatus Lokiarchaeota archaeon Loki_b31]